MARTRGRIYTASDLATSARKEFLEAADHDVARLRATSGEALVMLREAKLDHLAAIRDHALAYLLLDAAMSRPRGDRRAADFGPWAFIEEFDDDDIAEFQAEINQAIVRAVSGQDDAEIDVVLDDWRTSARTLSDPVAREILEGTTASADWIEVAEG